jgi:hypothetical protein
MRQYHSLKQQANPSRASVLGDRGSAGILPASIESSLVSVAATDGGAPATYLLHRIHPEMPEREARKSPSPPLHKIVCRQGDSYYVVVWDAGPIEARKAMREFRLRAPIAMTWGRPQHAFRLVSGARAGGW